MRNRSVGFAFTMAILLAGCANGVTPGTMSLAASDARAGDNALDGADNDQEALYLSLVDGLIGQGRQGAALAFLDSYRQTGELLTPRYWLLRGNALAALHRAKEATEAYSELRETPLAPQAWNGKGRIAADSGDWLAADECFRKAVDGNPTNADFLNNFAFAELSLNRVESAAASLQQAHELEPSSDRILINLAIAWTARGESGRADAILADVKDSGRRDAMRAAMKSAVAALNLKGKN